MDKPGPWPIYNPREIEPKWQELWERQGLYLAQEAGGKPKYYCLDFFPYPSGDGLHVGHCRNYIPTDVLSRFKRMNGYNVLHPMGWDAFGEPAEQYAIRHGVHPRVTTNHNTANFRRQMTLIGTSYDWSREINSSQQRVLSLDPILLLDPLPAWVGLSRHELAMVVRRLPDHALQPRGGGRSVLARPYPDL